jgi:uncharacterized protein (DUF427 family)
MKALWNNQIIAEASQEELIRIEGNWYFPPEAINRTYFEESGHHTTCHWKGEASYYTIALRGEVNEFGAWYYPQLKEGSIERVGKDFTNYIAFWNGVEISA